MKVQDSRVPLAALVFPAVLRHPVSQPGPRPESLAPQEIVPCRTADAKGTQSPFFKCDFREAHCRRAKPASATETKALRLEKYQRRQGLTCSAPVRVAIDVIR